MKITYYIFTTLATIVVFVFYIVVEKNRKLNLSEISYHFDQHFSKPSVMTEFTWQLCPLDAKKACNFNNKLVKLENLSSTSKLLNFKLKTNKFTTYIAFLN